MEYHIRGLEADGTSVTQPRLHPPCGSDPQVRPQYLPSVLQGEEHGYRLYKGMDDSSRASGVEGVGERAEFGVVVVGLEMADWVRGIAPIDVAR